MAIFQGNTFMGQRIEVDGNEFSGNSFQDCVLVFSATLPFVMRDNVFHNVRFEFAGPAAQGISLLRGLYHGGFRTLVEKVFDEIQKSDEPNQKTIV